MTTFREGEMCGSGGPLPVGEGYALSDAMAPTPPPPIWGPKIGSGATDLIAFCQVCGRPYLRGEAFLVLPGLASNIVLGHPGCVIPRLLTLIMAGRRTGESGGGPAAPALGGLTRSLTDPPANHGGPR